MSRPSFSWRTPIALVLELPAWIACQLTDRTEEGCWLNRKGRLARFYLDWVTEHSPIWTHFPPPTYPGTLMQQLSDEGADAFFAAGQLFYAAYRSRSSKEEKAGFAEERDRIQRYILEKEGVDSGN